MHIKKIIILATIFLGLSQLSKMAFASIAVADGYLATELVAGFPSGPASNGTVGPYGIYEDANAEILITSFGDGYVYRFNSSGGTAGAGGFM